MADAPHPDAWRATVRRRLVVVAVILATWATGVQARLVWLQVHEHDRFVLKAERQQSRTLVLPAMRGTITDREGRTLATSADVETVYAVPTEIENPEITARKLCQVLEGCASSREQYDALVERLSKQRSFAYVKRQVSPDEAARIEERANGRECR